MLSMRQLNDFVKGSMSMRTTKQWVWAFSVGLAIGLFFGSDFTKGSIIQDCKIVGAFRVNNAPITCTYHLVDLPSYREESVDKPKEKKK